MIRLCWEALALRTETVAASDQVRVLGVTNVGPGARCQCLCDVLLLASFTRLGVCGFCDVTRRLLQRYSRWGIQVHHRQVPASFKRRRSRCQRHVEV